MRYQTCRWIPVGLALLAGCGPAQPPPEEPGDPDPTPVVEPTPDPGPDPTPVEPTPDVPADPDATATAPDPADAAQALLQDRCTRCHGLDKVEAERADRAGWTEIVDRMIGLGVVLSDTERTDLIEHLAARTPS